MERESSRRRENRHISQKHKKRHESPLKQYRKETSAQDPSSRDNELDTPDAIIGDPSTDSQLRNNQDGITDLFFEDRKGDKYNLIYGTIHQYDIPYYYRFGRGRVIGLPRRQSIICDFVDGNKLEIRASTVRADDSSKRWKQGLLEDLPRKRQKLSYVPRDPFADPEIDLQKDFLPFHLADTRAQLRDNIPGDGSSAAVDYRSIEGKAKPTVTDSLDSETHSDDSFDFGNESARQRNIDLTRKTEDQPHDADGWLQLIDHQESLVGMEDSDGNRRLTAAEKRSVADIRISVCEEALSKLPPNVSRDKLLLRMMEEGSNIWDTSNLAQRWRSIIESNPNSISLWLKYLDFQQTRFTNFTYERCLSVFLDCLKINSSQTDGSKKDTINAYLILRLSLFMREAGFSEHSVALWQGILEFNFFRPPHFDINRDLGTVLASFEEFWDSEVARIGDPGAKGWDHTDGSPLDPQTDAEELKVESKSIFESWERAESWQNCNSLLPARTLDEVREDDPSRVVLFSDIRDFLIVFKDTDLLLNAFLMFSRLPPLPSYRNADAFKQWRTDPFFLNDSLDQKDGRRAKWFSDLREEAGPPAFPQHAFVNNTDTLFGDGMSWFCELTTWVNDYQSQTSTVNSLWARNALKRLVERLSTRDDLAEFVVALEFAVSPNEAKKYTKSLLKKRTSCMKLYNAYALIEHRLGNLPSAGRIWATTLSMSKSFPMEDRLETILLWRTWVWELLSNCQVNETRRLLLRVSDEVVEYESLCNDFTCFTASPAEILKAQRVSAPSNSCGTY